MNAFRVSMLALCVVCAAAQAEPSSTLRGGSVSPRDFFLYSCVNAYMKANAIRIFDGSVGYGVEHSRLSGEELSALHAAAADFAQTIRAPDYADQEHGLPAVLVLCQDASEKYPG